MIVSLLDLAQMSVRPNKQCLGVTQHLKAWISKIYPQFNLCCVCVRQNKLLASRQHKRWPESLSEALEVKTALRSAAAVWWSRSSSLCLFFRRISSGCDVICLIYRCSFLTLINVWVCACVRVILVTLLIENNDSVRVWIVLFYKASFLSAVFLLFYHHH